MKFFKYLCYWIGLMFVGVTTVGVVSGFVWLLFVASEIGPVLLMTAFLSLVLTFIGLFVVVVVREIILGHPPKTW